ncbi:sodium:solute symporter [Rhodohalobacter sulfatireducens]|uniref:Sodium:solute symporter n=1 Tax=Rhodohalobacter sulfatireducens TaxID=2911366 RepID=A0ABS9KAD0_9BACT|nr:sodium:solute symporter [Rhodohalobacter sulfatireducens]MCG2587806.1 sodium:solute symporter [Rhodohalobacter sulfatireducens]
MSTIDIIIFIVYLLGIVLFGISFYQKERTSDDYSTGSGTLPSWAIGLSIFATFVSSISFLALPGIAFLSNWNAFVFSLSIPVAIFMAIKFFIPLYRKVGSPSAYTFLEERFGPWAKNYVASFWLLTQVMRVAVILYLLALPMYVILDWDMRIIIIITGISVMIYSIFGGIKAVVWTDAIQAIILISGAVITLAVLMFSLPEGPAQYFEVAAAYDKFSLGSFGLSLTESTFWVVFIYGIFINLQNYGIDQNYIQRYMSARDEKEAISSAFGGGLLYIPVSLLFFMIGTGLFVYYNVYPDLLPAEYNEPGMSDSVFPYFIVSGLPVGMTGLLIASIFAAGMSTISTSLNSGATVILSDFYKRYTKRNVTEKESVRVLYIASAIICILGILISFYIIRVESALDIWWNLAGIFSGGMLGLFLLGYFSKKVTNIPAMIGVVLGLLVIIWMSLSPAYFTGNLEKFQNPLHSYLTIVIGTLVIFLTGFLLSLLIKKE